MAKIAVLPAALVLLAAVAVAHAPDAQAGTIRNCAHYQGHVYEVCFAFVVNCSYGAMLPYFMFGNSPNVARATAARNRLESRYFGQARRKLEAMVSGWPKGQHQAHLSLSILSVRSSLVTNTATLRIRWSWGVLIGNALYGVANAPQTITMKRVPGLILHKWVVTTIR